MQLSLDTAPPPAPICVLLTPTPTLIQTIKIHLEKAKYCEEKSTQHYISAGLRLADLKARHKQDANKTQTWAQLVRTEFDLGQSRADELIRIANGETTVEAIRAKAASRVQKHAKAKKSALANTDDELSALALVSELRNFSKQYHARVREWRPGPSDSEQSIMFLIRSVGDISFHLDLLAQELNRRHGDGTPRRANGRR